MAEASVPVGYPIEILLDALPDTRLKLTCNICKHLIRQPVQGDCGHRFCNDCIKYQLRCADGSFYTCSACVSIGEEPTQLTPNSIYPDPACRRELSQLSVHCLHTELCPWNGLLVDYDKHCAACPGAQVTCHVCHQQIPRAQLDEHVRHTHRQLTAAGAPGVPGVSGAPGVGLPGVAEPVLCPAGCGELIDSHATFQHVQQELTTHLHFIQQRLLHIDRYIGQSQDPSAGSFTPDTVTTQNITQRLAHLENQLGQVKRHIESISTQTSLIAPPTGSAHAAPPTAPPTGSAHAACSEAVLQVAAVSDGWSTLFKDLDIFQRVLNIMERETDKLKEQIHGLNSQHQKQTTDINSTATSVSNAERLLAARDIKMSDLHVKLSNLDVVSYDGTFTWRIDEFTRRRQEAISGLVSSIVSPAFYTSRTGYKLCLRVYLNGDGSGRSTHLSVFFVVARGLYDAVLRWPFRNKVTLMLLDQLNGRNHVTESFRPDTKSNSFQRPTTDMNIASGCPVFVALSQLDNTNSQNLFVRDNVMFIKAIVDNEY